MKAPETLQKIAEDLSFRINGWDEVNGAIVGNGCTFIGTHSEVRSYLEAWGKCRRLAKEPKVLQSMLVLRSSVPITSSEYASICVRPWRPFRGDRIAIPDVIAPYFEIDDIKIGNCSQFEQGGSQSAMLYAARIDQSAKFLIADGGAVPIQISIAEVAIGQFGRALSMIACQVSQDITMIVRLKKGAPPTEFEAMILGLTVAGW